MIETMTRGDLAPDLEITIADDDEDADFTVLTPAACRVTAELGGLIVVDDTVDTIAPAPDGKSAIVKRAWEAGETGTVGRMWLAVKVTWPNGRIQWFPNNAPLRIDIIRAVSDL